MIEQEELERRACFPTPIERAHFNQQAVIPYGCEIDHIYAAMRDFLDFLELTNRALNARGMPRLESVLSPASYSSMLGEFMVGALPKHCLTLTRNPTYNSHPDLLPTEAKRLERIGIDIKATRSTKGWQGHSANDTWLMVFVFDSNSPSGARAGALPRPFRFLSVVGARLTQNDWTFATRATRARQAIIASVTEAAAARMVANWMYRAPDAERVF